MPRETEVPPDLKPLLNRQAIEISDKHWKGDVELLAQTLVKIPGIEKRAIDDSPRSSDPAINKSFLAKHWIQLLLGFGVSVAIGLAPYLGKFIPLFTPMLAILPDAVQPIAIPLSAAAMGIVAILSQWNFIHRLPPDQVKIWFRRTIIICGIALATLAAIVVKRGLTRLCGG